MGKNRETFSLIFLLYGVTYLLFAVLVFFKNPILAAIFVVAALISFLLEYIVK